MRASKSCTPRDRRPKDRARNSWAAQINAHGLQGYAAPAAIQGLSAARGMKFGRPFSCGMPPMRAAPRHARATLS
jgi:hypothetical protein